LDFSAECIPANEVGGDYFDFVELGSEKIGIIIGDVSGKGTQAAFYMTLTKGFLKALVKRFESPAEVLRQMNALFYENVERGSFISVIYAIFDLETHRLTIARGGHNPVIHFDSGKNDVNLILPKGIALGIERGELFNSSIEDYTVQLKSNDFFVFFTDGFNEAINKVNQEFGMDRLIQSIRERSNGNSEDLIKGIFSDIRNFIGKVRQRDDMTIVVVKIG